VRKFQDFLKTKSPKFLGQAAVKEALKVLRDFYKGEHNSGGAGTAEVNYSMLQKPDWEAEYKGATGGEEVRNVEEYGEGNIPEGMPINITLMIYFFAQK
jgi:hypothetical protein